MRVITLKPQPLTDESFAPFGRILNLDRREIVCTDGVLTARITHAPLRDLSAEQPHFLNRHMEETQVFVPLGGKDGLFFVGPPSETPESFDPATTALFHFPGDKAIQMHVGTWHVAPSPCPNPLITSIFRAIRCASIPMGTTSRNATTWCSSLIWAK